MRQHALVAILCCVTVMFGLVLSSLEPAVLLGDALIGTGTEDIWGHTWSYWLGQHALTHGTLPTEAPTLQPDGQTWWGMDLSAVLVALPFTLLFGPSVAYNVVVLLHAGALAAGATLWAQDRGLDARLAFGVGLSLGVAPWVRGGIASGIPEVVAMGLVPLFVLALEAALRGTRRHVILASTVGALLLLDGLYVAIPAAVSGLFVTVATLRFQPENRRRTLARAAVVGSICAAVLALQYGLLRTFGHASLSAPVALPPLRWPDAGWVVESRPGADLLNLLAPAPLLPDWSPSHQHRHTVYLGLALTSAAALGAWKHRQARWLFGAGIVFAILSLGPRLVVGGVVQSQLPLPGGLLGPLGAHNTYRLAGVASVALLGAAVFGWRALRPRWAAVWIGLVLAEGLTLAPLESRLPTVPNPAGDFEQWLAQAAPGAVVDLPLDRSCEAWRGPYPERTRHLQAHHGRPVASGLCERPAWLGTNGTIAGFELALFETFEAAQGAPPPRRGPQGSPHFTPPPPVPARPEADRRMLHERGFRWVTLDGDQLGLPPGPWVERLSEWLGPPAYTSGSRHAWLLTSD